MLLTFLGCTLSPRLERSTLKNQEWQEEPLRGDQGTSGATLSVSVPSFSFTIQQMFTEYLQWFTGVVASEGQERKGEDTALLETLICWRNTSERVSTRRERTCCRCSGQGSQPGSQMAWVCVSVTLAPPCLCASVSSFVKWVR